MKQVESKCQNLCPKCGSIDIDWQDSEDYNGYVIYSGVCNHCKCEFEEHHKLVYEMSIYEE